MNESEPAGISFMANCEQWKTKKMLLELKSQIRQAAHEIDSFDNELSVDYRKWANARSLIDVCN